MNGKIERAILPWHDYGVGVKAFFSFFIHSFIHFLFNSAIFSFDLLSSWDSLLLQIPLWGLMKCENYRIEKIPYIK